MRRAGRRAKYIWLALLGLMVAALSFASVSGTAAISPVVALGMVVAYIGVLFLALGNIDLSRIGRSMQTSANTARMSGAARRAAQKARNRPEYGLGVPDTLVDIGFLINERRRDGKWDRRIGDSASLDDGALQPYIKLFTPATQGDRMVIVEFEFYDRSGRLQFRQKMEEYLREGDNLILCDRQLGLRGNEQIGRAGTWDLRVRIDGNLIGLHEFSMSTSAMREQSVDGEMREAPSTRRLRLDDDDTPVSLEDLLREQARRGSSQ